MPNAWVALTYSNVASCILESNLSLLLTFQHAELWVVMWPLSLTMESYSCNTKKLYQIFNAVVAFFRPKNTSRAKLKRGKNNITPWSFTNCILQTPGSCHGNIARCRFFPCLSREFAQLLGAQATCGSRIEILKCLKSWGSKTAAAPSYPIFYISPITSKTHVQISWSSKLDDSKPFPKRKLAPRSTSSGCSRYCAGFRHRLKGVPNPEFRC